MKDTSSLLLVLAIVFSSCSSSYPGAMDDPTPEAQVIRLNSLDETIELANGFYDLEAYVRGTEDALLTITAGDRKAAILLSPAVWKKAVVRGVEVTNGKLSVSASTLESSATYEPKTVYVRAVSAGRTLITGGDFSMLSQVEKNGGVYSDAKGEAGDCFVLSAQNGMNLARLRLYNDPGKSAGGKSFFKGIQDEANILALAKRAKAAGMEIELTFHYSDFWTNGGEQYKPAAWKKYTQEELHEVMYTYTRDFLIKMRDQGTTPQYVSIGNEIQSGILFGTLKGDKPTEKVNGYCSDMNNLASLLSQASKAVREVCPESKIILHLTTSADITVDNFKWFFTAMRNANLDYDIIGASYYPYYGNKTIEEMISEAELLASTFNKDYLFMEVGFAWNPLLEDGTSGQIANNDPYEEMTPEAQRRFMLSLTEQILAASSHILGYIYWDPIYIAAPNCGWTVGEKNVTGNSTLFDFTGKMLPAWDAFRYNH